VSLTGRLPFTRVIESVVLLTIPPHCVAVGALATVMPTGKVSVNPTPVSATVFAAGFVMVKVNVELFPTGAEKALLIDGGATTVNVAEAVLPGSPFVVFVAVTFPLMFG